MAIIPALVSFAPGTTIVSADMNSNFTSIRDAFNNTAVLTDLAKTITVTHTISADPGLILSAAVSRIVPGATSLSLRNSANSADNLLLTDAGAATFRGAIVAPIGASASTAKHAQVLYQNSGLSTTSAVEVSIASYPLPANALDVNGKIIRLTMVGRGGGPSPLARCKFGATYVDGGASSIGATFAITSYIVRTGAATQLGIGVLLTSNAVSGPVATAPAETLSGAITIDFRGQTGSGTLFVDLVLVELLAA